jgi:hypothetical protein
MPTTLSAQVTIWGAGSVSCGSWTKAAKNDLLRPDYIEWLLGFLSGYNWHALHTPSEAVSAADQNAVIGWIDNYCSNHPLDPLTVAADHLIYELRRGMPQN